MHPLIKRARGAPGGTHCKKQNIENLIKNPKKKPWTKSYLATALARSGWEFPDRITLPLWSIFQENICNVIRQKELVFSNGGREGSYQFALLLWLFNFVDIFFCGVTLAVLERLGKPVFRQRLCGISKNAKIIMKLPIYQGRRKGGAQGRCTGTP